jgi:hypothetical protein
MRRIEDRACRVPGCKLEMKAKGLCNQHYCRTFRGETVLIASAEEAEFEKFKARFWSQVNLTESCWIWTGAVDRRGYGRARWRGLGRAPRVAYFLEHGEFDRTLCVLHKCDTPACVNPAHLFLGTAEDNNRDCFRKGRQATGAKTVPATRRRGEQHWKAKITEIQAEEIRTLYLSGGITQRQLAARYSITQANVWAIVNGKNWRKTPCALCASPAITSAPSVTLT